MIRNLLQAGRWAPSSRNLQPWHFIVVRDRETLTIIGKIASGGPFIADAPVAIAIAMDRKSADRPELDAGRSLQQMELMAWSEGLGTCVVGVHCEEQNRAIKDLLGIPVSMDLITVMPFGYRQEIINGRAKRRKPLSEMAHMERFGESYVVG